MEHITISTWGREALFPDPMARRRALRSLLRARGPALLLFSVVDDHAHFVGRGGPGPIFRLLNHLTPHVRLAPPRVEPVDGRSHLENLVGYVLRQPIHHGLPGHPALWEGSCFPDLVGARRLPGFDPGAIWRELPRRSVDLAWRAVELSEPSPLDAGRLSPTGVWDAATRVVGAVPTGRPGPTVVARRTAAHLLAHLPSPLVARELGTSERTVRRLRGEPADPRFMDAARRWLAIAAAVRGGP